MASGLEYVQQQYGAMWRKLGVDTPPWPLATTPQHDGAYHVEVVDGEYRHIASDDRGAYVDLMSTRDVNQLLEWVAIQIAYRLTVREHLRRKGDWPHAEWVAYQIEQLAKIDPAWASRRRAALLPG